MTDRTAVARVESKPAALTAPDSFRDLMEMAAMLVATGLLPNTIRTPGQALAIILTGKELGMPPMRALRSLQIVQGKVIESADSQLARFKSDGGHATFDTLTIAEARLTLTHPNGDTHAEHFTIADAKSAGLIRGGDSNWSKYPKAMLRSRVITAGLKSLGWEGGAGAYDPDEFNLPVATPRPMSVAERPANVSPEGEDLSEPVTDVEPEDESQDPELPDDTVFTWGPKGLKGKTAAELTDEQLRWVCTRDPFGAWCRLAARTLEQRSQQPELA